MRRLRRRFSGLPKPSVKGIRSSDQRLRVGMKRREFITLGELIRANNISTD